MKGKSVKCKLLSHQSTIVQKGVKRMQTTALSQKGLLCEKVSKDCKLLIVFLRSFIKEFFSWVKGGHI